MSRANPVHRYTFHAAERDWLAASRQSTRGSRLMYLMYGWLVLMGVGVFVTAVRASGSFMGTLRATWPSLLLMAVVILLIRPMTRLSLRAGMRLNRDIVGEKTLEIRRDGLRWRDASRQLEVPWPQIRRVWETADHFFFRGPAPHTFFLPKAAVSAAELPGLRDTLRRYGGSAAAGVRAEETRA